MNRKIFHFWRKLEFHYRIRNKNRTNCFRRNYYQSNGWKWEHISFWNELINNISLNRKNTVFSLRWGVNWDEKTYTIVVDEPQARVRHFRQSSTVRTSPNLPPQRRPPRLLTPSKPAVTANVRASQLRTLRHRRPSEISRVLPILTASASSPLDPPKVKGVQFTTSLIHCNRPRDLCSAPGRPGPSGRNMCADLA